MSKALMGQVSPELHSTTALVVANSHLRRRVQDLESLVLRLQVDNDRLSAAVRDGALAVEDLQPV